MGRIIVGVDGSESARRAVQWAVEHTGEGDQLVLANAWNLHAVGAFESPYVNVVDFEPQAHQLVNELAAELRGHEGSSSLEVVTSVHHGHPGQVLIDLSDGADLLVVGSRGYGGFKGLLLGSVSTYIVHHAHCPVAVIPPSYEK
jgi:nucleotide-binding universal stress UspA family protein